MKRLRIAFVAAAVCFTGAQIASAYYPTQSLDYALCGYGGEQACYAMGYSTPWHEIGLIEPDPATYMNVDTYPMDCIDMGTGWCGESQSWVDYARVDTSPYWQTDAYFPSYPSYDVQYAGQYGQYSQEWYSETWNDQQWNYHVSDNDGPLFDAPPTGYPTIGYSYQYQYPYR